MSLPGVIPDTASNQTTRTCTHMRVRAHTHSVCSVLWSKAHTGYMVLHVCYIVMWLHGVKWANIRDFSLGSCEASCNVPRSLRCVPKMEPKMEPLIVMPDTISSWTPEVLLSPKLYVCWSSSFGLWYSAVDIQFLYTGWQGSGCTLP